MSFFADILATVAVAMGGMVLGLMLGQYTRAKRVGIIVSIGIGAWCLAVLIIMAFVATSAGGRL